MLTRTSVTIRIASADRFRRHYHGDHGRTRRCHLPARVYSPLVGVEADLAAGADTRVPLYPHWEYAALGLSGTVEVDGLALSPGPLLYLGSGRSELALRADPAGRVLLIGGKPFEEHIVMWWNFIGRDHDEIVAAREEWMHGARFGTVHGYPGNPLSAPPMPARGSGPVADLGRRAGRGRWCMIAVDAIQLTLQPR